MERKDFQIFACSASKKGGGGSTGGPKIPIDTELKNDKELKEKVA